MRKRRLLGWGIALPVLALLYFQALEERSSSLRRIGVFFAEGLEPVVAGTEPGTPAAVAGLRRGDVIRAIGGRPVADLVDYGRVAVEFRRGEEVTYRIERGSEVLDLRVRPGMPVDWPGYLINAAACLGHLALGLLAMVQWREDFRARLLTLLALAVAVELALPSAVVGWPALSVVTLSVFFLLTGFQFATEVHLASVIPERRSWLTRRPWLVRLLYVVGLGTGVAVCAAYLADVAGLELLPWTAAQGEWFLNNALIPVWALSVVLLLASAAFRHPEPVGRHQAALVLLGVLPWAAVSLASVFSDLAGRPLLSWVGDAQPLVLLCYPVAVFAAIFRYHLFDLELVVRRGLLYATLTSALILVFYAALGTGGALLSNLVGEGGSVWVVGAATLLLGLLFTPLRQATQRFIDRRLFPERDALRRRLSALAAELPVKVKLHAIGQHLVTGLREVFALRSATLLLAHSQDGPLVTLASDRGGRKSGAPPPPILVPRDDPAIRALVHAGRPLAVGQLLAEEGTLARWLERFGTQLAAPVLHQDDLVAVLLLGGKADGRSFPADEAELLDLFSHHVAALLENARLFEAATHDPLTGLLRRESILDKLRQEFERARRHDRPLAVGMADLDYFKEVNDRHGHLAGDMMLKRVAQALESGLRGADAIGRYGGEEFLLVLPETDLAGAAAVAEKLRRRVEELTAETEEGEVVRTTVSIGLASLGETVDGEGLSGEILIAAADRVLYQAKGEGRNRVVPSLRAVG